MNNIIPMLTNVLLNTFWQSMVVGLIAIFILIFLRRRPAAERVLTAMSIIIILALLPTVNFVWQKYMADWKPILAVKMVSVDAPAVAQTPTITAAKTATTPTVPASLPSFELNTTWQKHKNAVVCLMVLAWTIGALLMAGRLFYGLIFLRGFRFGLKPVSTPIVDAALVRAAAIIPLRRMPSIFTSPAATSPVTVGIFRPVMILPEKLLGSLNEKEILSIVLHEFSHVWHRDHLTGLFKRMVMVVYWWNPAIYFINTEHSDASEELSDNCALLKLKPEDYSECLLQLAEKTGMISSLPATIGMAARPGTLRQRVLNLLAKDRKTDMKTTRVKKFAVSVLTIFTVLLCGCTGVAFFQNKTTTVVDTFPRQGEIVDAATVKEVRVTFSNDMNTSGCWSFCSTGDTFFPSGNDKPHWLDKRTCAMSVKLVPGRTYALSFNAGQYNSFIDDQKRSTTPYKLTFKTKGESAETVDTEKPRVVDTFPRHGDIVDAATVKEIRVTFSEEMNTDDFLSIIPLSNASAFFPNERKVYWKDPKTCIIPVKLEPGKDYTVWFNLGKSYRNFMNIKGNSSVPYVLNFSTK